MKRNQNTQPRCWNQAALAGLALLAGCATTSDFGSDFNLANVETLRVGESTTQDAFAQLGKPLSQQTSVDGKQIWQYRYTVVESNPTAAAALGGYAILAGANTRKERQSTKKLFLEFSGDTLTYCLSSVHVGDEQASVYAGQGIAASAMTGSTDTKVCAGSDPANRPPALLGLVGP